MFRGRGEGISRLPFLVASVFLVFVLVAYMPHSMAAAESESGSIWDGQYDDLLAAARNEGKVVLSFGGGASRGLRPVIDVFEKKFGIKVITDMGSGAAQVDKILSEQRADNWSVDVLLNGANSGIRFVRGNRLAEIEPLLFLPEVVNQSLWYKGKHWYADYPENRYIFTYAAEATPPYSDIVYNTNLVNQRDFTSLWDVLNPKWKGKIVSSPPDTAGQGEQWPMAYVHPDIGPKWVKEFITNMGVFFTPDERTAYDGIAHGRWAFGIFMASPQDAVAMGKDGLPIALLQNTGQPLREAAVLRGSGAMSNLMVPRIQPDPNAAKVFLNWYLSREGQETVMKLYQAKTPIPSLREDITDWGLVDPNLRRKSNVDYPFITHDPAFLKRREEAIDFLNETYRKATGQ